MTNQDKKAALENALSTGAKKIKVDGQEVEYNNPAQLRAEINRLDTLISGKRRRPMVVGLSRTLRG